MKTIDEIRDIWQALLASGVNFSLYLGTGESDQRRYFRADLDDEATASVCRSYSDSVGRYFSEEPKSTILLSGLDDRAGALAFYDMDEEPTEFSKLRLLVQGPEPATFMFADHELSEIRTVAIKISSAAENIIFFKQFYPVSLVKRDQILLVKGAASRFELVNKDILKLTGGFEVMLLDNGFYINGLSKFERAFAFDEIANRAMSLVTSEILKLNLVDDAKGYLANFSAARRDIIRAGRSPVILMQAAVILAFVQAKQKQLGLNVHGGKLVLNSKESVRRLYKLLNDDYLTSGLTSLEYETLAKNQI